MLTELPSLWRKVMRPHSGLTKNIGHLNCPWNGWLQSNLIDRLLMEIKLPEDFKEFLKLLNANSVDYLLVGGYAVGYHGSGVWTFSG
jgi:2-hydroxy-3-keto-5-methylthiopentenyl-1-phosphate phosphatase